MTKIAGSGSTPKCLGSATLFGMNILKKIHPWFSTVLLSDKMEEKVQQIQFQQEIANYKDEIRDLQEKLETLKVRRGAKKLQLHRWGQKDMI
jgi:hypothetical protein